MTRSQPEEARQNDPPLRRHGEGHGTVEGTGVTDMTGNQAPTEEGHAEARDLHGGQTYETVAKLMRDSGFAGDPLEFTQGYNKELATVKAIRLKEISTSMGALYARTRRKAKDAPGAKERREVQSQTGPQGISGSSLVESRVHRLTGSGYGIPTCDDLQAK